MAIEASFPLREFQPPRRLTPLEILTDVLTSLPAHLAAAAVGSDIESFVLKMQDPLYVLGVANGFITGFNAGCREHVLRWLADLSRVQIALGTVLEDVHDLTTLGIAEAFVRPLFEDHPTGLLPQSVEILASKQWIANLLQTINGLDALLSGGELLSTLELVATDLVQAIQAAGESWIRQFFFQTGNAPDQGYLLGEMFGALTVEVVRLVVEPSELTFLEAGATVVVAEGVP